MQPITYSFLINMAGISASCLLAWLFGEPLLLVLAIILQTHALDRNTQHDSDQDEPDDFPDQPMGFSADLTKKK